MYGANFFRGRKRVYPGSFVAINRRPLKRPRVFRKKRRTRLNVNSQAGNSSNAGYSGKRLNRRRYNRILRDQGLVSQHYRSVLSSALVTTTSPANIALGTSNAVKMIASSFWTAAGGFTSQDFTVAPTFNDSDLTIRGAKCSISFVNDSTQCIRLRSWRAKTTNNGAITGMLGASVSAAWDPSHITTGGTNIDFQKHFKFWDLQESIIEPSDCVTRTSYLKAHKVDQDMFNADAKVDFWVYSVSAMVNSTAVAVNVTTQHNLSFTGDSGV